MNGIRKIVVYKMFTFLFVKFKSRYDSEESKFRLKITIAYILKRKKATKCTCIQTITHTYVRTQVNTFTAHHSSSVSVT